MWHQSNISFEVRLEKVKLEKCRISVEVISLSSQDIPLGHHGRILNSFTMWPKIISSRITTFKVEKILKGSLDSILSPSRSHEHLNFLFLFFRQNIQQTFRTKSLLTAPSNVLPKKIKTKIQMFMTPCRWWDRILATF